MTDNEIKKALKESFKYQETENIVVFNAETFKAIINHMEFLKADNERLIKCRKEEVEKLISATDKVITEIKAEARKEFAERLKKNFRCGDDVMYAEWLVHYEVDNILKEMESESNG